MKLPELVSCLITAFSHPGPDPRMERSKEVFAKRFIGS